MPLEEIAVFRMIGKQRRQTLEALGQRHPLRKPVDQLLQRHLLASGAHGRAAGGKEVAVGRGDSGFLRQAQRADEGVAQLRQKMQRSAQKRHAPADGLAAGQARNGLVHHGLEDAGRQVLTGRALVDKRLDVRLGEHAAARRNGINLVIARRQVVQPRCVRFQKSRHLVDKRTRAARAHTVHALLHAAGEIDDLRILSTQLNGHIRARRGSFQRLGNRHDLLLEGYVQRVGQRQRARPRHAHPKATRAQPVAHVAQKGGQRFLRARAVTAVVAEKRAPVLIRHHEFHRRRTDVDSRLIYFHAVFASPKPCAIRPPLS